ncbi:glycogen debranching enzyme [Arthrobacter pascens]|uniref:hypothetical protein n=1 Tax=Arthrobacter pascens TaxID=1677 RepID=UPI00285FFE50|nr:hypothetical protein [Arthrobacter pascens]MDR6557681.1 glycogen debranching enzyme [Arthrobacter pascens]
MAADTMLAAEGAGDAADHFGNALPELFGGFARAEFPMPVEYHHAGSPQAWAAAARMSANRPISDQDQHGRGIGRRP